MPEPLRITAAATSIVQKRVESLAYGGGEMVVPGYDLPIVVELSGMEIPASIPLLANHKNTVETTVGSGVPQIVGGELYVSGTIVAANAAGQTILNLGAAGVPLEASIGAENLEVIPIKPGQTVVCNGRSITPKFGLYHITRSRLREVSIVANGADPSTSATIAAHRKVQGTMKSFDEWVTSLGLDPAKLTEEQKAELNKAYALLFPSQPSTPPPVADSAPVTARRAEAERIEQIDRLTANLAHVPAIAAARREAAGGRMTLDTLQTLALEEVRASRANTPTIFHANGGQDSRSMEPQSELATVSARLMIRAGFERAAVQAYGERTVQAARRGQSSLVDIAAAALRARGHDVPHDRPSMIRASLSTNSLPIAMGEAANKIVADVYRTAQASWKGFSTIKSANDFRDHHALRATWGGNLTQLPNGGEIKHGVIGEEETYTYSVATFAKMFSIGRQTIINDDAKILEDVVPGLGRAAARSLSDLVYTVLLANDGNHFHASNGNLLTGGGSALSSSSLANAIKALRKMQDADGNALDLQPAVLLVPPELEMTGRALLESTDVQRDVAGDNLPTGNTLRNTATLAVEPRLSNSTFTGNSATQWYLFASPADSPFVVAFLEGASAPVVETFGLDHDVAKLAFQYRVYHDYGATLGDKRTGIKSAGA